MLIKHNLLHFPCKLNPFTSLQVIRIHTQPLLLFCFKKFNFFVSPFFIKLVILIGYSHQVIFLEYLQPINALELAMEALKEIQLKFHKDFPPHPKEQVYGFATLQP